MPSIYVASLSDYNAGRLHGRWIDADQDAEAIAAEVQVMLAQSLELGAEEWAIHDHDGFGGLNLSEWESLEWVAAIGAAVVQHGADAVAGYLDTFGADADLAEYEDSYHGRHVSFLQFVERWADDVDYFGLSQLPRDQAERIGVYLDYEALARDLRLGGDFATAAAQPYGVHVFTTGG